jgi:cytochrome c-type biogenesis protein CcmF
VLIVVGGTFLALVPNLARTTARVSAEAPVIEAEVHHV